MNRKNIKRVRDVIAGLDPARFDMSLWSAERGSSDDVPPVRLIHDCDTCGCIGGWTDALFKTPQKRMGSESAARRLGLSEDVAQALFYPWEACSSGGWSKIKPAHAARVLDHLLETGEVDWASTRRAKKPAVAK